jgi:hypothetical protein
MSIVLYILIFPFLDSKDERFCTEWLQAFPHFKLILIPSQMQFFPNI